MCGCGIDAPCYGCSCGCDHGTPSGLREQLERMYAIYSPKPPSLRDDIAGWLASHTGYNTTSLMDQDAAGAIIALVQRHIDLLDTGDAWGFRQDVLTMLGSGDD